MQKNDNESTLLKASNQRWSASIIDTGQHFAVRKKMVLLILQKEKNGRIKGQMCYFLQGF